MTRTSKNSHMKTTDINQEHFKSCSYECLVHNTAWNSSDSLASHTPDNHNGYEIVYWRAGPSGGDGEMTIGGQNLKGHSTQN